MNQQDPLAQLRDIHLPDIPGWWPPAPGWWILAALVLAGLGIVLWVWRRHYQQQAYRRQAAEELEQAWAEFMTDSDAARYAHSLSQILRRTALAAYPRHRVASLGGAEWQQFLDASSPDAIKGEFLGERGDLLATLSYRPLGPQVDLQPLHALSLTWVQSHRKIDQGEDNRAAV